MGKTDGGPAFPTVARDGNWQPHHDGMSLRDYFAAKALQGLMANPNVVVSNPNCGWYYCNTDSFGIGMTAYEAADAMLKAREAE